LFIFPTLDIT